VKVEAEFRVTSSINSCNLGDNIVLIIDSSSLRQQHLDHTVLASSSSSVHFDHSSNLERLVHRSPNCPCISAD